MLGNNISIASQECSMLYDSVLFQRVWVISGFMQVTCWIF